MFRNSNQAIVLAATVCYSIAGNAQLPESNQVPFGWRAEPRSIYPISQTGSVVASYRFYLKEGKVSVSVDGDLISASSGHEILLQGKDIHINTMPASGTEGSGTLTLLPSIPRGAWLPLSVYSGDTTGSQLHTIAKLAESWRFFIKAYQPENTSCPPKAGYYKIVIDDKAIKIEDSDQDFSKFPMESIFHGAGKKVQFAIHAPAQCAYTVLFNLVKPSAAD